MLKKTFLLLSPDYSDFPQLFVKNLEEQGFSAEVITDSPSKFKYRNNERLLNFFHKTFFKNKNYKKELIEKHNLNEYYNRINIINEELDYILVIRPDLFPIAIIKELKKKTKKLIAYQWDGIEKFPSVKKYIPLFDSFFCFDAEDQGNAIRPITNFYFDFIPPVYKEFNHQKPKLYFVGLYWESREKKIDQFIEEISKIDVDLSLFIQYYHRSEIKNPKIKYIKQRITFLENLKSVEEADVLLDFVDPAHNGLSIRFFEALYYKKKIITDNKMVKMCDFYHPDNIFIIDDNYDEIEAFIKTPYQEISENIVESYSFSTWIRTITK